MDQNNERELFFSQLARRVISDSSEIIKASRNDCANWASGIAPNANNSLGEDVDPETLVKIEKLFANKLPNVTPWEEAQLRELAFWRWVAFEGYADMPPEMFQYHQEHFMISTFYRTAWSRQRFADKSIFELGCGPLGMIEYLPGQKKYAYDPLNDHYNKLFFKSRDNEVNHIWEKSELDILTNKFDFAICHNVIDHTEDPAWWFNLFFDKIDMNREFIFQVNLSRSDVPQTEEHRKMHPSPFERNQVLDWLGRKSDDFNIYEDPGKSRDGEFYFLAWGKKASDNTVHYLNQIS